MSLQMHAHIDPHTDPKLAVRDANVSMISSRLSRTPAYGRRLKHRQFWRVALSPRPRWQMKGEKNRTVQLVKIRMRHVISAFLCGCCNCGNCTIADINVVSLRQRKISAKINTPMSRSSWHDHVHKKNFFFQGTAADRERECWCGRAFICGKTQCADSEKRANQAIVRCKSNISRSLG